MPHTTRYDRRRISHLQLPPRPSRALVYGHNRHNSATVAGVLVLVLALALPAGAGAGELVGPPAPRQAWELLELEDDSAAPRRSWETPLAAGLLAGANLADAVTTHQVLEAGGHEANAPWLYGREGQRLAPAKAAVAGAQLAVFHWIRSHHEGGAWAWVAGCVAVSVLVAYQNHQLAEELRAR